MEKTTAGTGSSLSHGAFPAASQQQQISQTSQPPLQQQKQDGQQAQGTGVETLLGPVYCAQLHALTAG